MHCSGWDPIHTLPKCVSRPSLPTPCLFFASPCLLTIIGLFWPQLPCRRHFLPFRCNSGCCGRTFSAPFEFSAVCRIIMDRPWILSFGSFLLYLITTHQHHGCASLRLFNGFSDYPSAHFIKSLSGGSDLASGFPSTYLLSNFFLKRLLNCLALKSLVICMQFNSTHNASTVPEFSSDNFCSK